MYAADGDRRIFFDVLGAHTGWREGALVERPVIVFVHGGPGFPHLYFRPWISQLAKRFCVVVLDLRGSGWSSRHSGSGYPLTGFVDDVELVRRTLGVDQVVLLGHSFGGPVVMEYALAHPDRVRGLVLACTIHSFSTTRQEAAERPGPLPAAADLAGLTELMTELVTAYASGDAAALEKLDAHPSWDAITAGQFHHPPPALWAQVARSSRIGAEAYMSATGAAAMLPDVGSLADWDIRPRLGGIHAPTLVLAADSPAEYVARPDAHARVLADGIPGATLTVEPDVGHYLFAEAPETFARDVTDFLESAGITGAYDDQALLAGPR
ncbi:MAG: alpha/beta fold hydrolase [Actinomycetota bacterium]|nr:alpha/beta fold hydrolase [Actinomycetota bacterium]